MKFGLDDFVAGSVAFFCSGVLLGRPAPFPTIGVAILVTAIYAIRLRFR